MVPKFGANFHRSSFPTVPSRRVLPTGSVGHGSSHTLLGVGRIVHTRSNTGTLASAKRFGPAAGYVGLPLAARTTTYQTTSGPVTVNNGGSSMSLAAGVASAASARDTFISLYTANAPKEQYEGLLPLRDAIMALDQLAKAAVEEKDYRRAYDILMYKGSLRERSAAAAEDRYKMNEYELAAEDYHNAVRAISMTVAYLNPLNGIDFRLNAESMEMLLRGLFAEAEALSKAGKKDAPLDRADAFFHTRLYSTLGQLLDQHGLFNMAIREFAEKLSDGELKYLNPVLNYVALRFYNSKTGYYGVDGRVFDEMILEGNVELLRQMQEILDVNEETAAKIMDVAELAMAAGTVKEHRTVGEL